MRWRWSRPLQWSFFDHPPLAFWIAGGMQALFGRDLPPLLLRLPFVLMFTGSSWALFALTARFYGARAGLWAAGLGNLAVFFFASAGSWVVPDGPRCCALLLAALSLAKATDNPPAAGGRWQPWLLAGLFLGLALLSKYQAILTLVGAFCLLLTPGRAPGWHVRSPMSRRHWRCCCLCRCYGGTGATTGVSFRFQLAVAAARYIRALPPSAPRCWGKRSTCCHGSCSACCLPASPRCGGAARAGNLFLALALPPILLFNLLPLLGSAGLPHWSMAGWLFLFPLLGRQLADARDRGRRWPLVFAAISGLSLAAIAVFAVLFASNFRLFAGNDDSNRFLIEATSWSGLRRVLRQKACSTVRTPSSPRRTGRTRRAPPKRYGRPPRPWPSAAIRAASPSPVPPGAYLGEDALIAVRGSDPGPANAIAAQYFDTVEPVGSFETSKGGLPAFATTVVLGHHLNKPITSPYAGN